MNSQVIKILDENTANKIAAGEVVERPASAVKELVENSLDAYSHKIEVAIDDGGSSFIRVSDDGMGMNPEDAKLAILRHATSKISSAEDLYCVQSLGFRGEALPSIASVSRFSLTTRLHTEQLATYLEVTGGEITDIREAGGGVGTTVTVTDLFYNTPARRKFLKTAPTESGYIHDIIGKLALSHPEVAFKLINNQRLVLSTNGNGNLLDTLASLYGPKICSEVFPVSYEGEEISISGYVAKPTLIKSSRQWQTFTVNGRIINSRLIAKALDNAYHSLLPKTGYPLAMLKIAVPAETIDVNVHPQKSELKFRDESKIFKAVYRAIADTLASPEADRVATPAPTWREQPLQRYEPQSHEPQRYETIHSSPGVATGQRYETNHSSPGAATVQLWHETPLPFTAVRDSFRQDEALSEVVAAATTADTLSADTSPQEPFLRPLGQVENCYIIATGQDGLYIIDQHAAHERIIYDRLCLSGDHIPVQQLLIPLLLDFDSREIRIIEQHLELFQSLGFLLEPMGPNTMRIGEMPADILPADAQDFIYDILKLVQTGSDTSASALRHAFLQTAACHAAIKAGDSLNMRQIQALLQELWTTALPYTCPHGRPIIIKFGAAELAKMFKRS